MNLFVKTLGEGRPLIILHGLFGSGDNWITHAREFANHFKVYLIDQRNHGHSPHSEEFSYKAMADDLLEFAAKENLRDMCIIGHSMGGKTAMYFALENAFLIDRVVIADMGIKQYKPHHEEIFKGLLAVDVERCEGRKEAEERLLPFIQETGTRQFLLKNLYWKEAGKLAWRFNLPVLFEKRDEIIRAIPEGKCDTPMLFLRGADSHYVTENDFPAVLGQFPRASLETIDNAGHWLHADQPEEFRHRVLEYLL
ncbi:MAG: alpha/beta fold hydrolase [Flavobacteriales bacterium]